MALVETAVTGLFAVLFIALCVLWGAFILPPAIAFYQVATSKFATFSDKYFPIVDLSEKGLWERWVDYWVAWEQRHKD